MSSTVTSRPSSKAIGLPEVCVPTSQSSHLSSGSGAAGTAGAADTAVVTESKASKSEPTAEVSSQPAAEVRSRPTAEITSSPSVIVNAAAPSVVANVLVKTDSSPPLPGSIPLSATRALIATSHDCVSTVLHSTNEVSTAANTTPHAASLVGEQISPLNPATTNSTLEVAKKPRAPKKRKAAAATTTTTTTTSATETKKPPRKRPQTSKPLQPVEANKPAANAAVAHEEKAFPECNTRSQPTSVPNDSRNGPPASTPDAFLSLAGAPAPDQSLEQTLTSLCQYDATTLRQVSEAILTSPTFATLVDTMGAVCSSTSRSLPVREGSQNAASQEPSWGSPIRPDPNFRGHD
ncbi:unnamed protein product [Jaminaea pallidilutea]